MTLRAFSVNNRALNTEKISTVDRLTENGDYFIYKGGIYRHLVAGSLLRSLYLTVLVTATLTVLVLSVLALVGVPIIDLPPARALYPTAVGGHLIPINKLAIIAIYIALVGLITAVTIVSLIFARGKKREN